MNGILLVDKPYTWTSFDAVNYVRRIIAQAEAKKPKQVKVGHIGTLDPLATGLLVLLIGSYTKRATEMTKLDKTYETTLKLGETSTTGDAEGQKTAVSDKQPTQEAVAKALDKFTGELKQTPPVFSAIKVDGQRAYKLARQGKTVELVPRSVEIYENKLTSYDYPRLKFVTKVSSGTYIRSLAVDMGEVLGTGAYMADLRRLTVGPFELNQAVSLDGITPEIIVAHILE